MSKDRLELQECIETLFHYYWIHRDTQADLYFKIIARKTEISDIVREYFGYRLISRNEFVKLEKIPVTAQPFMGISDFTTTLHYIFFCCFLAFLEDNGEDRQFTLQYACDAIRIYYPEGAVPFAWEQRSHRKTFADMLQHCVKLRLINVIDRDIEGFRDNVQHDVLLQTTAYFRHFAPLFFFDLSKTQTCSQLKSCTVEEIINDTTPTQRIMRRLFLEAAIYDDELTVKERELLENADELEKLNKMISEAFEYLQLERYHRATILSHTEYRYGDYYPKDDQISNAVVQYATYLWDMVHKGEIALDHNGNIRCLEYEAMMWFQKIKDLHAHGWTKYFTERPVTDIWRDVMNHMSLFKMADVLHDGHIKFYSATGRVTGDYSS